MVFERQAHWGHPAGGFDTAGARIALVLAGCGARDGSEITEAVSLLIAFSQLEFEVTLYAPERHQHHTVDHLTHKETAEVRNCLVESARIARGQVQPLSALQEHDHDALFFCGGFGSAKNLCTFAIHGKDALIFDDVKAALLPFLKKKKPVGALCIAPLIVALGARELGWQGYRLTLGDGTAKDAVDALELWGGLHERTTPQTACIDETFRLVSAPAYMFADTNPAAVFACAVQAARGLRQLLMASR